VSTSSSGSAAECIDGGPEWLIEAGPGQRVNVTLWDFGHRFHADSAAARLARGCIKYATVIEVGAVDREREKIVCGSRRGTTTDRLRHVYTSLGNAVRIRLHVIASDDSETDRRATPRFLIHYQGLFSLNQSVSQLECGPMPNLMVALPNIGGALCSTPQSLADAHY